MRPTWPTAVYCTTLYCTDKMHPTWFNAVYWTALCSKDIMLSTWPMAVYFTRSNVQIQCILSNLLLYPVQLSTVHTGTVHPTRPTALYCTAQSWIDMYNAPIWPNVEYFTALYFTVTMVPIWTTTVCCAGICCKYTMLPIWPNAVYCTVFYSSSFTPKKTWLRMQKSFFLLPWCISLKI
jgi:hypothetical protein